MRTPGTGTVGDAVALSFSQDKIIDAVSGGALVNAEPNVQAVVPQPSRQRITKNKNG